jgi:heme exporter protein A
MTLEFSGHGLGLWRGDRCLCRDLEFRLGSGEALQLLGPNGAGKTSLIRVLTGLGRLDEGEVRWNGASIGSAPDFLPSTLYLAHANGLKAHLSSVDNLVFYQSITKQSSELTAHEALDLLGIGDLADQACSQLSMGQRRRVALARLLLSQARLWFLDEPLTSLDADGAQRVAGLVHSHLQQGGMAVFATHQPLPHAGLKPRILELVRAA